LSDAEISRATGEYPKLRGRYRGHAVAIDAVVDHIAVRKLPSLWLRATVFGEIPYRGSCDVMARSHGVEFYSPAGDLDHVLKLPLFGPVQVPRAQLAGMLDAAIALIEDLRPTAGESNGAAA